MADLRLQYTTASLYRLIRRDKQRIEWLVPDFLQIEELRKTTHGDGTSDEVAGVDEADSVKKGEKAKPEPESEPEQGRKKGKTQRTTRKQPLVKG
jgi:hypothetical protein